MTGHVIIDAAERFARKASPPPTNPMFRTALKTLPFVSSKWKNKYWPESMWTDVPTGNYKADCERGKHFAELTLGAMLTEPRYCDDRTLAVIFEQMVADCARRRAKGGKGAHTLPGAVCGYLDVLAKFMVGKSHGCGPPAA